MNKEKLKTFVKTHKTAIVKVCTIAVITTAGVIVQKKLFCSPKDVDVPVSSDWMDIRVPNNFRYKNHISNLGRNNDTIMFVLHRIKMTDLGKYGNEFVRTGLVKNGKTVDLVVSIIDK